MCDSKRRRTVWRTRRADCWIGGAGGRTRTDTADLAASGLEIRFAPRVGDHKPWATRQGRKAALLHDQPGLRRDNPAPSCAMIWGTADLFVKPFQCVDELLARSGPSCSERSRLS